MKACKNEKKLKKAVGSVPGSLAVQVCHEKKHYSGHSKMNQYEVLWKQRCCSR